MTNITLTQAILADVHSLASLNHVIFGDDRMSHYIYHTPPQGSTERGAYDKYHLERGQSRVARFLCNPRWHTIVAKTAEGTIVGAAVWVFAGEASSRRLTIRELITYLFYKGYDCIVWFVPDWLGSVGQSKEQAAVIAREKRMHRTVASWEEKFIPEEIRRDGYNYLAILGVVPNFRRQGIAGMLLRWGCERADEEGRAIYVCSSNVGAEKLYSKHGFTIIGKEDIGEEGEKYAPVKEVSAMLRLPGIKERTR